MSDKVIEDRPDMTSPKWHDYVMSKFEEDEVLDGCPYIHGLRRVTELLFGPLTVSNNLISYYPEHKLAIAESSVTLSESTQYATYVDVADAHMGNTDYPYNKHLVVMAAKRAEAHNYRKILRLRNIIAVEEKSAVAEDGVNEVFQQSNINANQIMVFNTIGSRHNINIEKFINSGSKQYASVKDISYTTAVAMLEKLQEMVKDKDSIEASFKGYNSNWSKK